MENTVSIQHQLLVVRTNGDLISLKRAPDRSTPVGVGWNGFQQVFYGGEAIYAIRDGNLLWYSWDFTNLGIFDPGAHWQGPKRVGVGWNYQKAFASVSQFPSNPASYLYGITSEGQLTWAQHLGASQGKGVDDPDGDYWVGGIDRVVGTGWAGFKHIFSTQDIIYTIQPDGTLLWYKHLGQSQGKGVLDGDEFWDGPNVVGRGWQNFVTVFATSLGPATDDNPTSYLFAVRPDGKVLLYGHQGWRTGKGIDDPGDNWLGPSEFETAPTDLLFAFGRTYEFLT
jgi:hypothetical protein